MRASGGKTAGLPVSELHRFVSHEAVGFSRRLFNSCQFSDYLQISAEFGREALNKYADLGLLSYAGQDANDIETWALTLSGEYVLRSSGRRVMSRWTADLTSTASSILTQLTLKLPDWVKCLVHTSPWAGGGYGPLLLGIGYSAALPPDESEMLLMYQVVVDSFGALSKKVNVVALCFSVESGPPREMSLNETVFGVVPTIDVDPSVGAMEAALRRHIAALGLESLFRAEERYGWGPNLELWSDAARRALPTFGATQMLVQALELLIDRPYPAIRSPLVSSAGEHEQPELSEVDFRARLDREQYLKYGRGSFVKQELASRVDYFVDRGCLEEAVKLGRLADILANQYSFRFGGERVSKKDRATWDDLCSDTELLMELRDDLLDRCAKRAVKKKEALAERNAAPAETSYLVLYDTLSRPAPFAFAMVRVRGTDQNIWNAASQYWYSMGAARAVHWNFNAARHVGQHWVGTSWRDASSEEQTWYESVQDRVGRAVKYIVLSEDGSTCFFSRLESESFATDVPWRNASPNGIDLRVEGRGGRRFGEVAYLLEEVARKDKVLAERVSAHWLSLQTVRLGDGIAALERKEDGDARRIALGLELDPYGAWVGSIVEHGSVHEARLSAEGVEAVVRICDGESLPYVYVSLDKHGYSGDLNLRHPKSSWQVSVGEFSALMRLLSYLGADPARVEPWAREFAARYGEHFDQASSRGDAINFALKNRLLDASGDLRIDDQNCWVASSG